MNSQMFFQIQSFCVITLLTLGVIWSKKRDRHIKTMYTAIIWDIVLILQIELSRNAIFKASKAVTNPVILNIHVTFALLSVLLYFAMIYTGRKFVSGNTEIRPLHKKLGYTTYIMRLLTLITSFWAVSDKVTT